MEASLRLSPSRSWDETRCHVLKAPSATVTPWLQLCSSPPATPLTVSLNGGADEWEVGYWWRIVKSDFEYAEFFAFHAECAPNSLARYVSTLTPGIGHGMKHVLYRECLLKH